MSWRDVAPEPTPEEQWWSVRAGEYVLGTLQGQDRELFEKILHHDAAIGREVDRWTRWLAGLDEDVVRLQPGRQTWPRIRERIRHHRPLGT